MSTPYHHGDLKASLIAATLEMVKEDQVHLVGFRELARQIGVSRTAPYRHFKDVEELLAEVAIQGFAKFIGELEKAVTQANNESIDRFVSLGVAYVNFAVENSAFYRLMFFHKFNRKEDFPQLKESAFKSFHILRTTIADCLEENTSALEIDRVTNLAWASVHGISTLAVNGHFQHIKDLRKFIHYSCEKLIAH